MTNPFQSAPPNPYQRRKHHDRKKEVIWEGNKRVHASPTEFDNLLEDDILVEALAKAERSLLARTNNHHASKPFVAGTDNTAALSPSENVSNETQVQKMTNVPLLSGDDPPLYPTSNNTTREKSYGKQRRGKRDKDNSQSVSTVPAPTEGDSVPKDLSLASPDWSPSKGQQMPPNHPSLRMSTTTQEEPLEIDFDLYCLHDAYLLVALETAEVVGASKATVTNEEESDQEPDRKKAKLIHPLDSLETRQHRERPTYESVPSSLYHQQGPPLSSVKIPMARNPYIKDEANRFDSYCFEDELLSQVLDDCESSLAQSMSTQMSDSPLPSQGQTSDLLTPGTQESLARSAVPIVTPTKRQLNPYARSAFEPSRQPEF